MKQRKTLLKSTIKRLVSAVSQTKVNEEEVKEECFHRRWDMKMDSICPDCGMSGKEMFKPKPFYPMDKE